MMIKHFLLFGLKLSIQVYYKLVSGIHSDTGQILSVFSGSSQIVCKGIGICQLNPELESLVGNSCQTDPLTSSIYALQTAR